jgi:hypothetical protein
MSALKHRPLKEIQQNEEEASFRGLKPVGGTQFTSGLKPRPPEEKCTTTKKEVCFVVVRVQLRTGELSFDPAKSLELVAQGELHYAGVG